MGGNDLIILDQVIDQQHKTLAPKLKQAEFFELFVAEQVLKDFDLSYDEFDAGIVGDGGNGGIDGIYIFANGELVPEDYDVSSLKKGVVLDVYILQAKRSEGFQEIPLDKLIAASEDLFDLSKNISALHQTYHKSLIGIVDRFRKVFSELAAKFPALRFHFVYATRGDQVHPNVRRKAEKLSAKIASMFSSSETDVQFIGAADLLALARREPKTSFTLTLAENPISSAGEVGYISLVRLRDFDTFISDENKKLRRNLFESNVRDYQGATEVNEEIQKSLSAKGKEDFWWLNNGVTILAGKATQSGKMLTLEDPQIVNGLQTSTEVHNYFSANPSSSDERNLLVRVIVPSDPASRDRIIKATNSQTSIPPASLRATDKIHRDIEEYLRSFGFFYDRRKNSHKMAGRASDQIVSIPLMAQAVMAIVLGRPDSARARPSSLLKKDDDYKRVFASDYNLGVYFFCISIEKQVETYLRLVLPDSKDRNNIRFYMATFVASKLVGKSKPSLDDLNPQLLDKLDGDLLAGAFEEVYKMYADLGGTDQVAKGRDLVDQIFEKLDKELSGNE